MQNRLIQRRLIVQPSPIHGYGVFADEDIKRGDIIEECYSIILNDDYLMRDYIFNADGRDVMVLGNGSIYNHQDEQYNADYFFDIERSVMVYRARDNIKQGDEIFIYYSDNWFASRYATAIPTSKRYKLRRALKAMRVFFRGIFAIALSTGIIYIAKIYVSTHG